MTEPFRLRFVNQIVGAFILGIVALMLVFVVYLVQAKELFTRSVAYEIHIEQSALDGLRQGTEVQMLGQDAGEITSIDYSPHSNKVIVKLAINEPFKRKIFVDSTVHVRHKYGVGESYLEILRGEKAATVLDMAEPIEIDAANFRADEDRIEQLRDEIRHIREMVEKSLTPTLESVRKTSDVARQEVRAAAVPAFDEFRDASKRLGGASDVMHDRIQDTAAPAFARFGEASDAAKRSISDIVESVQRFEADSHETMASFRKSTEAFQKASEKIERAADALPATTEKLDDTVGGAQDVIEGLKRNRLLKRYLRPENSSRQTPPSGIRGGSGR
jgi:ABC-type transporter Mla subunit MlaD